MPAARPKQQGEKEREVDERANDRSMLLMSERNGRDLAGNEPIDDRNRDPSRNHANRIPSDIPDPHRLQREAQPDEQDSGDDDLPRSQAWDHSLRVLKRMAGDGGTDRRHQDRGRYRGEEKMQSSETRIEAEQETQHGTHPFRCTWPQIAFRAVNRGDCKRKSASSRFTGSLKSDRPLASGRHSGLGNRT